MFVYQSRSGRALLRQQPDGSEEQVPCRTGREGVVHLGVVLSRVAADSTSTPENYSDGTTIWWRWHAPAEVVSRSGFVPREEVCTILGYKSTYNFRGFGEAHSGLRELTDLEFAALLKRFRSARPLILSRKQVPRGGATGKGGGESKEHCELKEFVAANPSAAIGEVGLRTIKVEFSFPTGDRADIVLADRYDRVIGVEIEPKVGDSDDVGVLQAIKYRRMLEWSADRAPGDSRSLLVAYAISDRMRQRCAQYAVQCVVIERERLRSSSFAG